MSHEDDDRRDGERRDGDRRRFRSDPGRRDPSARARRLSDRARTRSGRLLALGLVLAVLGFSYRAVFVSPRRGARAEAQEVGVLAAPLLGSLRLPMQAVPGLGPPIDGDPVRGVQITAEQRRQLDALSSRLALASKAAPGEVEPHRWQAPIRLALGDERGARIAWQEVLALGDAEEAAAARVGIAALQIRAGLREADEQDRAFALESALRTLEPVDKSYVVWPHRLVEEALARLGLGHEDTVDAVLVELGNVGGEVAGAALPGLRARRSGERPLSASLDALVDRPPAPE